MQGWTATTRKRNMDILVASRNGDRIFMVSIRITSRPPSIIRKWNKSSETSQDLSWLHFDDEPRVKEKQQVKDQQSCFWQHLLKTFYPYGFNENEEYLYWHTSYLRVVQSIMKEFWLSFSFINFLIIRLSLCVSLSVCIYLGVLLVRC